jgi:hypothetical protein
MYATSMLAVGCQTSTKSGKAQGATSALISWLLAWDEPERNDHDSRTFSVILRNAMLSGDVLPPAAVAWLL